MSFLVSLLRTLLVWLDRQITSLQPAADPLAALILRENVPFGPSPVTGGHAGAITAATAATLASFMRCSATKYGVDVAAVASIARGEGDNDPNAIDPNNQDAKPGETPTQALEHEDVGIEQEDVRTAEGDPQFAGKTPQQIVPILADPAYGIDFIAKTHAANLAWARGEFKSAAMLPTSVPNGDVRILAYQAYNSGQSGALAIAIKNGRAGNWAYGLSMAPREDRYRAALNEPAA